MWISSPRLQIRNCCQGLAVHPCGQYPSVLRQHPTSLGRAHGPKRSSWELGSSGTFHPSFAAFPAGKVTTNTAAAVLALFVLIHRYHGLYQLDSELKDWCTSLEVRMFYHLFSFFLFTAKLCCCSSFWRHDIPAPCSGGWHWSPRHPLLVWSWFELCLQTAVLWGYPDLPLVLQPRALTELWSHKERCD